MLLRRGDEVTRAEANREQKRRVAVLFRVHGKWARDEANARWPYQFAHCDCSNCCLCHPPLAFMVKS